MVVSGVVSVLVKVDPGSSSVVVSSVVVQVLLNGSPESDTISGHLSSQVVHVESVSSSEVLDDSVSVSDHSSSSDLSRSSSEVSHSVLVVSVDLLPVSVVDVVSESVKIVSSVLKI